jgi:hypothetical protein
LKKTTARIVLVVAAFLAVPSAAHAAGYVPTRNVIVSGTVSAGATSTVSFSDGSFTAGERVGVSVTGAGAVALGALPTTTVSTQYSATQAGSVTTTVTFPVGASGTYSLTATGTTSGNVAAASLTVGQADAVSPAGAGAAPQAPGALSFTGSTMSLLSLWVAGGVVALGAGGVAVRMSVRRHRDVI